jgi:hypothetical protein
MTTTETLMQQDYLVINDRGALTAYVTFSSPLGGTSSGPLALDDDAEIAAKAEELLALVATKEGLTRAPEPGTEEPS